MGFGKDGKGVIIDGKLSLTLGALASNTSLKSGGNVTVTDHFRMIKLEAWAYARGLTAAEAIVIGIADDDLTVAEIEAKIETSLLDPNDRVQAEESQRPVFLLEIMQGGQPSAVKHIERTIRWTFHEDTGWTWFAYNPSSAAALTTGCVVEILQKAFGVWVK